MSERLLNRQKRRERLITFAYSIFSLFMTYVSVAQGWPAMIVPIIIIGMAFVWWAYLTHFQDFSVRGTLLTLFASLNIFFYVMNAVDFSVTIPTLCCYVLLFSLYQLRSVMAITITTIFLLFLYHAGIKQTFVFFEASSLERERIALQLLSLVIVLVLCVYRIHRDQEEDDEVDELEHLVDHNLKIKDDFVANTSHELRTPINTISGMSEILLQEDLPEDVHREVQDIQMTGIELQTIVTDILDYAALESDELELNPRAYNITSTLNDIMNMTVFQNREKQLELIFDCDPSIPCSLYGDEQQLRRIINNLIGNAIKFTSHGGVTVTVSYRKEEYGINLIVSVKDTGIGLSKEEQERIFQGFYQADSDRNRQVEGMGLGLTISSSLIRHMGGFLTVSSQPGKGSTFTFSIPQKVLDDRPCIALTHPDQIHALWYFNAEASESAIRDDYIAHINHIAEHLDIFLHRSGSLNELKRRLSQPDFTHLLIGTEEYREDPLYFDEIAKQLPTILIADRDQELSQASRMHILYKPYNALTLAELFNGGDILSRPRKYQESRHFVAPEAKVLVVDDNIMNLKVVEGLLRKFRIKITAASSGEDALEQIHSKDYDFVFMDHMMPGMDGVECFHRIRAMQGHYYETVPIIALTANAIAGSREMFLEEGFDDFVAKPIDNAVLDHILETYIPDNKKVYEEEASVPSSPPDKSPAAKDPLEQMDGIDLKTALAYCGGERSDFIELANIYVAQGEQNARDIDGFYQAGDWKNYAIAVHALKSTSRTIGATNLADLAYKEELAAKEEDAPTLHQYHPALLEEYDRILTVLRNNPELQTPATSSPEKPLTSLDATEWEALRRRIRDLLETYEGSAVEQCLEEYRNRSYDGKPLRELLAPVLEKVDAFDFEGAQRELDQLGGEQA